MQTSMQATEVSKITNGKQNRIVVMAEKSDRDLLIETYTKLGMIEQTLRDLKTDMQMQFARKSEMDDLQKRIAKIENINPNTLLSDVKLLKKIGFTMIGFVLLSVLSAIVYSVIVKP